MPSRNQFKTNKEYNDWFKEYREKNREKFRKYNREYNKKWRQENGYPSEKKYKKKYPQKYIAGYMMRNAIIAGKIKKLSCEKCGNEKSQGHHKDYFKPLEVIWLCTLCHKQEHMKN